MLVARWHVRSGAYCKVCCTAHIIQCNWKLKIISFPYHLQQTLHSTSYSLASPVGRLLKKGSTFDWNKRLLHVHSMCVCQAHTHACTNLNRAHILISRISNYYQLFTWTRFTYVIVQTKFNVLLNSDPFSF